MRDPALPAPGGKPMRYRTIVVDPPWRYRDLGGAHGTAKQYSTMSLEDIASLSVGDWAEDDAHLYIWATNHFVREAVNFAEGWGFDLKTMLTWVKHYPHQRWLGMGRYYRNATEHVVFAARGSLAVLRRDCSTVLFAPRKRHSAKPEAFYDMVETMSPGPYLDVFARRQRQVLFGPNAGEQWGTWGNECFVADGLTPPEAPVGRRA